MNIDSTNRQLRSRNTAATQLSARKKLLLPKSNNEQGNKDDDMLAGIEPLPLLDADECNSKDKRKSQENQQNEQEPATSSVNFDVHRQQQEELQNMLSSIDLDESQRSKENRNSNKRLIDSLHAMPSPPRKHAKLTSNDASIPTKSFYNLKKISPSGWVKSVYAKSPLSNDSLSPKSRRIQRILTAQRNRGVKHKIRKRRVHAVTSYFRLDVDKILAKIRNAKLRDLIVTKRRQFDEIEKVHRIFRSNQNPIAMAKPLRNLYAVGNNNNNKSNKNANDDSLYDAFNTRRSPNNDATSPCSSPAFSDLDDYSDESEPETAYSKYSCFTSMQQGSANSDCEQAEEEQTIPLIRFNSAHELRSDTPTTSQPRKFFKTGHNTNTSKQVKMAGNIRALMRNGKLTLMQTKDAHRRFKVRSRVNTFGNEQATVNAILATLNESALPEQSIGLDNECNMNAAATAVEEAMQPQPQQQQQTNADCALAIEMQAPTAHAQLQPADIATAMSVSQQAETYEAAAAIANDDGPQQTFNRLKDIMPINEFRRRLPYNTDDPAIIQQQRQFIDFLVINEICNEAYFHFLIVDPNNSLKEIEQLVQSELYDDADFRSLVNTTDQQLAEQQHLFLDFLIDNFLCTEDNLDMFLHNYETRFKEAEQIVMQELHETKNVNAVEAPPEQNVNSIEVDMPLPINLDANLKLECNTEESDCSTDELYNEPVADSNGSTASLANSILNSSDLASTEQTLAQQQTAVPVTSVDNANAASSNNFYSIFTRGFKQLVRPSTRRLHRQWTGGFGSNQYQIDAGQTSFGASQCKHCGLVYTMHEPEEEKLHRDYHTSLHVFRLNRWIDEDIVAVYPEWGNDGRILRVNEASLPKRVQRIKDVLRVVDKELGFSSYVMPKTFVVFLAVRRNQIVGICVVHPLERANQYVHINGVDCCTEHFFNVKCGISRIWVAPFQRRMRIGARLYEAVRMNTLIGYELKTHEIAFSAPTEMGKEFAQSVCRTTNFLVYS